MAKKITFDEQMLMVVQNLAAEGRDDDQIAAILGISKQALRMFATSNKQVAASLEIGRSFADEAVVAALFSRAVGYATEESRKVKGKTVVTKKQVPPDVQACMFWLKQRRNEEWGERIKVEHHKSLHASLVDVFEGKEVIQVLPEPEPDKDVISSSEREPDSTTKDADVAD